MQAYRSQGDPGGAGGGEVEAVKIRRHGGVWALSGHQTATGEELVTPGGCGGVQGSWTVIPNSVYNRLQEVPFSNTGGGSSRGRRRQ